MNNPPYSDPLAPTSTLSSTPPLSETKIDLLWRNRQASNPYYGYNVFWKMEDTTRTDATLLTTVADAAWQIVGTADANQDGVSDFLWRNSTSGVNLWWYMNQQGGILQGVLLTPVADVSWAIVGVGDQNNDGQIDILWRNETSGTNAWWLMQGTEIKSSLFITPLLAPNGGWEIKGVADVNQDGLLDIFWNNKITRQMAWWVMENNQASSKSFLIEADPGGGTAIGVADFNNDKSPDIVLRNFTTGANTLLITDGGTILDRYTLEAVDPSWEIVGLVPRVEMPQPALLMESVPVDPAPIGSNNSARFFTRDIVSAQSSDRTYRFNVQESGLVTVNLTGLTGDADVQLIQDANGNGQVDSGEAILAWQWERGTTREALRRFINAGSYLLRVSSYAQQTAQYSLSSNFTVMASDPNKFNLVVKFGAGTESLTQAAKDAIDSAARFWENVIPERSSITDFKDLTITILGKAQDSLSTLAIASPLVVSRNNSLVIVEGEAELNILRYDTFNSDPNYLRSIMIHELAHTLGFGTLWEPIKFPSLKDPVGRLFVNSNSRTYNGNSYAGYSYGELIGQFGNGVAVPLDDILAHWSESVFDRELLTPIAEGNGIVMPLSALTLSALRDMGWKVNYGAAQAYSLVAQPVAAVIEDPENKIALQET